MDRREFVQTGTAAGVAMSALGSSTSAQDNDQPRRLRAGVIGTGWYGMVNCRHLINEGGAGVEVNALCDVDSRLLNQAADEVQRRTNRRPQTFEDFRQMLRPRNLDIVIVGTPDHWHALHAIAAMEAGADVYVEKPICHTYLEGKAMVATARRLNRVVQVGTQRRSTPHIVSAREFYREGNLGRVGVIRAYCYYSMRGNENPPNAQPPEHFNYDLWTGPAPMQPYNSLVHPRTWRKFTQYSNGILGDMGIHMLDVARWFTGDRYPRSISSTGGIYVLRGGRPNITDTQTVTYDYDDKTMIWEHRTYGRFEHQGNGWGVNFYGERGTLQVTLEGWDFFPHRGGRPIHRDAERDERDDPDYERAVIAPAGRAHWQNFLSCVRSRQRPVADIEEGHISTALCVLGTVSQELGRSLRWNAETEQFVNDDEANRKLRRDYRRPWQYPGA